MWQYPADRYYYNWYDRAPDFAPTDGDVKAMVVERLRVNPYTADCKIRVDVKRGVAILSGDVGSTLAKRTSGDDCWDTPGVTDVSNQLCVTGRTETSGGEAALRQTGIQATVGDVMTPDPISLPASATVVEAARLMRDASIGDVLITQDGRATGMLTDRDIVVRCLAEGMDPATCKCGEVCSRDLICVSPNDEVQTAVLMMRDSAIRRLPVVHNGVPVGVITLGDLSLVADPTSALADISAAEPNL